MSAHEAAVTSIDADLARWFTNAPFSETLARLCAYRGITQLGALNLAAEGSGSARPKRSSQARPSPLDKAVPHQLRPLLKAVAAI